MSCAVHGKRGGFCQEYFVLKGVVKEGSLVNQGFDGETCKMNISDRRYQPNESNEH